jgi:hypothetical protein
MTRGGVVYPAVAELSLTSVRSRADAEPGVGVEGWGC